MYSGYGATSPPLTNNPFISPGNPSARFPDISTPPQPQQQQQYGSWSATGGSYPQQQQQPMQQQQMAFGQPQQQMGMVMGGSGYLSPAPQQAYPNQGPSAPFQPSSSFGQQLAAHVSGSSYGYLQGQQQQQQSPMAYNPAQQQLQSNPGYIAQFDPYSSLGQALGGSDNHSGQPPQQNQGYSNNYAQPMMQTASTGSTMSAMSGAGGGASYGVSASGTAHPKDFIRTHKAEIEAWNQQAWKQLIDTFEALMQAWEARKNELSRRVGELAQQMQAGMAYGPYYVAQIQQEGSRIQGLSKEAEDNFDSVTASTFQMKEVFEGYRQSSDMAGKRRVKEATNAALQGLPGWPQPYQ